MNRLLLDKTEVVMQDGGVVQMTVASTTLTDTGTFTYDIVLPLNCAQNQEFFRNWQRQEVKKDITKTFEAVLYVNERDIIVGNAKILSSTSEIVTIQLFGDRSALNAMWGDVYIDEMKLPYVFKTAATPKSPSGGGGSFGPAKRDE